MPKVLIWKVFGRLKCTDDPQVTSYSKDVDVERIGMFKYTNPGLTPDTTLIDDEFLV